MMSPSLGRQIPERNEVIINHNVPQFKRIVSFVEYITGTGLDISN